MSGGPHFWVKTREIYFSRVKETFAYLQLVNNHFSWTQLHHPELRLLFFKICINNFGPKANHRRLQKRAKLFANSKHVESDAKWSSERSSLFKAWTFHFSLINWAPRAEPQQSNRESCFLITANFFTLQTFLYFSSEAFPSKVKRIGKTFFTDT